MGWPPCGEPRAATTTHVCKQDSIRKPTATIFTGYLRKKMLIFKKLHDTTAVSNHKGEEGKNGLLSVNPGNRNTSGLPFLPTTDLGVTRERTRFPPALIPLADGTLGCPAPVGRAGPDQRSQLSQAAGKTPEQPARTSTLLGASCLSCRELRVYGTSNSLSRKPFKYLLQSH